MFLNRPKLTALALATLAALVFVGSADAGWVIIKNETGKPIVVQEVATINGKQIRGKPTKLLAGESFREFQNTPGVRNYEILDAAKPNTVLWSNQLNCKSDKQSFSVGVRNGRVGVAQVFDAKK